LRKRNLGPILDANGWAVNAKAKVNVPFGTSLTGIAKLPAGASVDLSDKYAPKSSFLPKLAVTIVVLACVWSFLNDDAGRLYDWTNGKCGVPPLSVRDQIAKDKLEKSKSDKLIKDAAASVTPASAPAAVPPAPAAPAAPAK
jgi:hypothetical protein